MGQFTLAANDEDGRIHMSINFNGIPSYKAQTFDHSVIKTVSGSGVVAGVDVAQVSATDIAICQAYDAQYERRKCAWVKMQFIPRYKTFIANPAEGSTPAESYGSLYPPAMWEISDSNGVNVDLLDVGGTPTTPAMLFANLTGVRMRRTTDRFKVFRRSLRMPLSPRYLQSANITSLGETAESNPSGAWQDTDRTAAYNTEQDHWGLVSNVLPNVPASVGLNMYDVTFQIKYIWYDKKTVYVAPT